MTPCPGREKSIAWLALDALDAEPARELRAHLETCPGCRHYFAEMSQLTGQIAAAAPPEEISASDSFHRQVMVRIKAAPPASPWVATLESLRIVIFNWRTAVPATVMVIILLVIGVGMRSHSTVNIQQPAPAVASPAMAAGVADPAPTIANYHRAASQSLEKLDALLSREDTRADEPTQICTASTMSLNF